MAAAAGVQRRIVVFSFQDTDLLSQIWGDLLSDIRHQAKLQVIDSTEAALTCFQSTPVPDVVLLADAVPTTKSPEIWDAVIKYVRNGGVAIATALFSSFVRPNGIGPFFSKAGLDWKVGDYRRTIVAPGRATAAELKAPMPGEYSQKAVFLTGVNPAAVLYGFDREAEVETLPDPIIEANTETAAAFAGVGHGWIGYTGDVNAEAETIKVVLAMCHL